MSEDDELKRRVRAHMTSGDADAFYRDHPEHRKYPVESFNRTLPPATGTTVMMAPTRRSRLWAWVLSFFFVAGCRDYTWKGMPPGGSCAWNHFNSAVCVVDTKAYLCVKNGSLIECAPVTINEVKLLGP